MTDDTFTLQLNIDYNDLVGVKAPPGPGTEAWLGQVDGVYPEAKFRALIRMAAEVGFDRINFRVAVCGKAAMRSKVKEPADHYPAFVKTLKAYDPFRVAIDESHEQGIACYAWLTPLDDSGSGASHTRRGKIQSGFSHEHPEWQLLSRDGKDTMWGVYCFGHPEVLAYWRAHLEEVMAYEPDGVFFSNRTHSNMKRRQKHYGFNPPTVELYRERHGVDPRAPDAFDLVRFSEILGEFYTNWLRSAADLVRRAGGRLAVAASWRRDGHIARRLGALDKAFFQWRIWCDEGIIDELVIGGDAATSRDPEHILPHLEVRADSANPAWFRKQICRDVPLSRWLTLWDWYWPGAAQKTPGPYRMFTTPVVREMLTACRASGLDGVLMHEALNIATHKQWDVYRAFNP